MATPRRYYTYYDTRYDIRGSFLRDCRAVSRHANRGKVEWRHSTRRRSQVAGHHGFDEALRDWPDERVVTMPAQAADLSLVQERGQQILMIELGRPMFNQLAKLVHMPTRGVYHASQLWRVNDCGAELVGAQLSP